MEEGSQLKQQLAPSWFAAWGKEVYLCSQQGEHPQEQATLPEPSALDSCLSRVSVGISLGKRYLGKTPAM